MTWGDIRLRRLVIPTGGSWGVDAELGEVVAPCIRGTDFDYEVLRTSPGRAPLRGFSAAEFEKRCARRGDLIVEKSGGGEQQPVGRVVLHAVDQLVVPTNFAGRLRPNKGVEPRFLCYLFASLYSAGRTTAAIKQTTGIQNLDLDSLLDHQVRFPPESLQCGIADYLDAETARIDALIVKKRRLIDLLQERLRSIAANRIAELIERFGSIALRRLVVCLDAQRVPLSAEERAARQGPYPYYGASSVVDWIDAFLFDEDLVLVGEDGAQLGDPHYAIAQRVSGRVWVNNHAHVLRPRSVDPDLLVFHLNTLDRMPYMSGSTREKITQEDLGRIPFPCLSQSHQREVARMLIRERDLANALTQKLQRQIDLLVERRQALITAAVTGELAIPGVAA